MTTMDKNSESNQDGKARPKNIFVITSMYSAAITELTDRAIGKSRSAGTLTKDKDN